ncbi:hypothetical protein MMC28_011122 [Mycoblastus sanguinarius]|nr:hypothetical protein [Mycoblastus sanguinarius]
MALAPASEVVMSTELYDEKIPSGLSKAVQVAKDSPNLPPAVKTMLEKEVGNLWRRIQARPETYIMSKEEFAFFNYYRGRYHAENIAQHAVARFWTNYRDSSSTVEGAESSKVARWNSLRAPPPGFLGPAQRSTAWQDSLDEYCQTNGIGAPNYNILSDRRGKQTARSCTVSMSEHTATARYWYDGTYVNTAKEDAAEVALLKELLFLVFLWHFGNLKIVPVMLGARYEARRLDWNNPLTILACVSWSFAFLIINTLFVQSWLKIFVVVVFQRFVEFYFKEDYGGVHVLNGEEYSIFNSVKISLENLTGELWDWWPLTQSFRRLRPGELRIQWCCKSSHTHWSEISREDVFLFQKTLKRKVAREISTPKLGTSLAPSSIPQASSSDLSNTDSSERSDSQSSGNQSSPQTSDNGSPSQPNDGGSSAGDASSDGDAGSPKSGTVLDIMPPSRLKGFVLFGVQGSKRLRSARTYLAQIDVAVFKDDDSFFDELGVQYKSLRGYFRWIFSIWEFYTCEFVIECETWTPSISRTTFDSTAVP